MKPLLSILIPTLPERAALFQSLRSELERQRIYSGEPLMIEIEIDDSPRGTKTIGEKRNDLVSKAKGEYIAFIDDDDEVSRNYIQLIINAIRSNNYPDCVSLKGVITWDGQNPQLFEHSLKYSVYRTETEKSLGWFQYVSDSTAPINYLRMPNHLNAIKAEIVKQFPFIDKGDKSMHGEDTDFSYRVYNSGLIKSEGYIPEVIYHYQFKPSK